MLEDLLQACQPHTIFPDQSFFYKMSTHRFTLELDTLPYPALHEIIHIVESPYDTLLH